MIKQRTATLFFSMVIALAPLHGQSDEGEKAVSLSQAREHASKNAYAVQKAVRELEMAEEEIWSTTARGLPQVELRGNYQDFIKRPVNLIPAEFFGGEPGTFTEVKFGSQHNLDLEGQVSQLIFDGSYIVGIQASKTVRMFRDQRVEKAKREARDRASEAYYSALVAKRNHAILRDILSNFRERFEETSAMYEEGLAEEQQKDQIELNVLSLENRVSSARRNLDMIKDNLKLAMGMPLKKEIALSDSLEVLWENLDPQALAEKEFTPDEHIDHRMAETQVALKELQVKREKTSFLPRLNGYLTHRENAQRAEFNFLDAEKDWFPSTILGVNLTIPVFQSGKRVSDVKKAKLDARKARTQQRETAQQLRLRVERARTSYIDAREQLENDEKSLQLARDIMDKTLSKHREGIASSLELTQVKDQLLQSQQTYVNTLREVLQAHSDLEKALAGQ